MSKQPNSDRPLAGRRAAITGSTSGIGQAIADALARAGADIALNGLGDPAPSLAEVRAHGTKVVFVDANLMDGKAAQTFVYNVQEQLGGLDILVNNAGIQHVDPIEKFPDDKWDAILGLNLSASFHTIKAAVPAMRAANWGRIVNIASAHGLRASPYKSAYVAAKHGLVGLTKTVALELAETLVTANSICPGFVDTPLVRGQIADQAASNHLSEDEVMKKIILASQPTHRFVTKEEVADCVLFLCSPAAANITGSALSIDGGWTAR